jgi:hypothetical protein
MVVRKLSIIYTYTTMLSENYLSIALYDSSKLNLNWNEPTKEPLGGRHTAVETSWVVALTGLVEASIIVGVMGSEPVS